MGKKVTLEDFIERARAIHGDRYDYSKVAYKNNSTKVEVVCREHGSFFPKPINHIQNKSGCPACAGCKRTTAEDFIERARAIHGDRYDYSTLNYAGVDALVTIRCPDHGIFQQIAYDHTQGHGCKSCGIEKCASAHRRSLVDFIAKARALHGDRFDYSRAAYINSTTPIEIICPVHGSFWQAPQDHITRYGCRACAGLAPVTLEEFIGRARMVHGDRYDYSRVVFSRYSDAIEVVCREHGSFWQTAKSHAAGAGCPDCSGVGRITEGKLIARGQAVHGKRYDYSQAKIVNGSTPVEIICLDHGMFLQRPIEHGAGAGCPVCAGKAPITRERFIERARAIHGDRYNYNQMVFSKYKENVAITCAEHGEFWQTPYNHAQGSGCPTCAREQTTSKGESDLAQWVASLGLRICRNDRTALGSMEIDIFLPDLKTGIEYNGAYWHSDGKLPHPRIHEVKASKARDAGIRLITIWDFDWTTRVDFVKRFLLHALGLNSAPKINARSCDVRWIDASVAAEFYNRTHIQGAAWRTIVNYGLFAGDDLVACMSFSQGVSRRGMMGNAEWELARFATDRIVRGGAGKIFSTFIKNHTPHTVWSFSDRQHFSGGVYPMLGFKEDGRLPADYRVFHEASGRIWHKSAWQRKHIPARLNELGINDLFDPKTDLRTERDMQKIARVLRIMDAGKIRWKWTS